MPNLAGLSRGMGARPYSTRPGINKRPQMCKVTTVLCLAVALWPLQGPARSSPPPPVLRLVALEPTQSGFTARFNTTLDPGVLNLYAGPDAPDEEPDLVLLDGKGRELRGSCLWDPSRNTLRFIKTGLPLQPGRYTLIFSSRADGFVDSNGGLLDGDGDGRPGGDLVARFAVAPHQARTISMPDFAATPGQRVELPLGSYGLSVFIDDANEITDITLQLSYDPSLLSIEGAHPGDDLPAAWACSYRWTGPGSIRISASGSPALPPGPHEILLLSATVQPDARPGSSQVIEITSAELNSHTIPVRTDQSLQVVTRFGDATGDGRYSREDAALVAALAVGAGSGLDAHPLVDPVVICDVSGDGRLNALDASLIARKAGLPAHLEPQALPVQALLDSSPGPSTVSIATNNFIRHGEVKDIPVRVEDVGEALALDAVIFYDTNLLDVLPGEVNVTDILADWQIFANVEDDIGRIRIATYGIIPLAADGGDGDLLLIRLREPNNSGGGISELVIAGEFDEGLIPAEFHNGAAIVCCVPGDYDYDCDIDLQDFSSFALLWRQSGCAHCQGRDFTGDKEVKFDDLAYLAAAWLSP